MNRLETLGPAERIINMLTTYSDHIYHGRPGVVRADTSPCGFGWTAASWKQVADVKAVFLREKGKKPVQIGVLVDPLDGVRGAFIGTAAPVDKVVMDGTNRVGTYRASGIFPEVARFLYSQIASVYDLDNEFVARWGSWAFAQEHRDLKCLLAAFLLVQPRAGSPVIDNGAVAFYDDDYREVGEAMCLLRLKNDISPKHLLRVGDILQVVATVNRQLCFGRSDRNAPMGRYSKLVERYLRCRERNEKWLQSLIDSGWRRSIINLACRVGYRPESPRFFKMLRWKQAQSNDGRRTIAVGVDVEKAESWEGYTEGDICRRIVETKPNWKRVVGMLPTGITRAIIMAACEAGSFSDSDYLIYTPTFEELGMLAVPEFKARWDAANVAVAAQGSSMRAANIAKQVKNAGVREQLNATAEEASKVAVQEVVRDMRIYFVVDKSGSMQTSISTAKECLTKLVPAFPPDRIHISVFNTVGVEVTLKASTKAAVELAFQGHNAGGGTCYAEGVRVLTKYVPKQNEDALIIFVGDEGETNYGVLAIEAKKLSPVAFGLLKVPGENGSVVSNAAKQLGIPCIAIDLKMFDDPYAIPRILKNLVAATPVGKAESRRKTLVQTILETDLLKRPVWAT